MCCSYTLFYIDLYKYICFSSICKFSMSTNVSIYGLNYLNQHEYRTICVKIELGSSFKCV